MHRLREWFGIKDWQGPLKQSILNPDKNENDTKQDGTQIPTSSPVAAEKSENVNVQKYTIDRPQSPLYDKAEVLLKQYIPHKEGTCYSCKLITLGMTTFYMLFSFSILVTQHKKIKPKVKPLFFISGLSATTMAMSFCYLTYYDHHPLDLFKSKEELEQRKNR